MADNPLVHERCEPLAEGTPPLSGDEIGRLLGHLDGWRVSGGRLERTFRFEDHYRAMAFVNAVAWISHREDHHPDLAVGYDAVTVRYVTHSIGGLSRNDFVCAAKVDRLTA